MLPRLLPHALAGIDDQQEQVDPRGPRDHVSDEPLVARHVHQGQPQTVAQIERRIAEVDRDAAPLLLGQPVRILSGQRPDEPGLAVVDVTGGSYRERQDSTAPATSSTSASESVRQSSNNAPSRTTPTTGGVPRRNGSASSSSTAHA